MNYKKNSNKYSLEEIADAHIISADIPSSEKQEITNAFREERKKMFLGSTNEQRTLSSNLQIRFQMEDYHKAKSCSLTYPIFRHLKEGQSTF